MKASALRVRQLAELSCPNCEYPIEKTSCAARIASAGSRTRVRPAASPSIPAGRSAPIASRSSRAVPGSSAAGSRRRRPLPSSPASNPDARSGLRRRIPAPSRRPSSGAGARKRPHAQRRTGPTPRRSRRRRASRGRRRAARSHRAGPRASRATEAPDVADARPGQARCLRPGPPGEILARFERKGLRIAALKLLTADGSLANEHYAEHADKPFFGELVSFITGGPLVAAVLEGTEAVSAARQLIGATNPIEAAPGSIRGDLRARGDLQHGPRLGLG